MNPEVKKLFKIGYSTLCESSRAIVWMSGLQIDADGSPNAYGPNNSGLDWTSNAGHPGHWEGVATDQFGRPVIQSSHDPSPGKYVSTTSLQNPAFGISDTRRYVNSETIPFLVIPEGLHLIKIGDLGVAYNTENGYIGYFICADEGPPHQIGEGSIKLAQDLGIKSNPKIGGVGHGIAQVVFPYSGEGFQSIDYWKPRSIDLFEKWGGLPFLKDTLNHIV